MERFLLDTSFIFSFADKDDINHIKARKLILNSSSPILKFYIPYIVVAELVIGSENFDFLSLAKSFSSNFVKNNEKDLEFIAKMSPSLARSLKANDCLILAIASRLNLEILTFDEKLKKAHTQLKL